MNTTLIPVANRLQGVEEYYFSKKLQEIRDRNARGEDIINLGIGNPDLMPPDDAIRQLIHTSVEQGVHGYQAYRGTPALREAFANWYQDVYGAVLNPATDILPLMGSKEGIVHLSLAFLDAGDEVLVPDPGYPTYASAAKLAGATIRNYPLHESGGWYPDLQTLEKSDLSKVKMMWVNYPHMPTGALPREEVFEALIAFGQKHRILICHDNPYSLVLTPTPMSILAFPGAMEVAVELNSLSKSHNMAGWRIGMLAGSAAHIDATLRVKSNMDSGMFLGLQAAATRALATHASWHHERNQVYQERRLEAEKLLNDLGCSWDTAQGGMFLWARIPESAESGEAFSEAILNASGVFLTPGFIFGPAGHGYIRASLCTPVERLQDARERVRTRFLTTEAHSL